MSGSLADIIAGYLDLRWSIHPVEATHAGRHEFDGAYPAYDAASRREQLAALRSYTNALEEAPAESLDDEIDRTAALHDARHLILLAERERPFATNPALHLMQALAGIHILLERNGQDPPRRAAALLERLRALPAFLRVAGEALTEPARPLVALASSMLPGSLALIREGLDDPAVDLSSVDAAALAEARAAAADALRAFGDALTAMEERATQDGFAIGRDLFDRKLHTAHMIQENADELYRYGERLRDEVLAEVRALAAEVAPAADWRDVIARLREDRPDSADVLAECAASVRAARDFVQDRGLARLPEADVRVQPTPQFLRALVPFMAYQGAGAFDEDQRGVLFVSADGAGVATRAPCRSELPGVLVHESIPGHHLQIAIGNQLPRALRRVIGTPAMREGWALYAETLMAEYGFLATPGERLFHAYNLLWRALRVMLDVALHTRGMTVEAAARTLAGEMGFPERQAAAEVVRYCAYPTYQLSYAVGRRDLLRLRDDERHARGTAFTPASFHDQVLSYGALPTALARWGMGLA